MRLRFLLVAVILASTSLYSQSVSPGPDLCQGVCASGSWTSYTIETTISSSVRTGDNRPQDSTDTCHVTIFYRKRICSSEVSPDAKVSIIIDGVCTDCPKQTNDLLGRIIMRALVEDDPLNLRQAGKTKNEISFSTKRCWAMLYCEGTFCSIPCACDTTDAPTHGLRDICEACCITYATISVDGQCNINARIDRYGYAYNSDETCAMAVPPTQCLDQQTGSLLVSCAEVCPLFVNNYEYRRY